MEQASEVLMDDDNDDNDEEEDGMANDEADGKQRSDARMMNIMTLYSFRGVPDLSFVRS